MTQNEIVEENSKKRQKLDNVEKKSQNNGLGLLNKTELKTERCIICRQYLNEVTLYNGHPNNSIDEYVALTDEKLMLFTGEESCVDDFDTRPTHKVTYFSVYDKNGHLCPFDTGLIESNKLLYFSGYIKPIYDEDCSTENGIPTKDMGPINEWWISGYDGGEKALLGFSTECAEYYLVTPSPEYEPFMKIVRQKMLLTKIVIEFLTDKFWDNPTYEDLLHRLESSGDDLLNEEILIQHAQFVCDQVMSIDVQINDDDRRLLITAPCMRALVKMAGVDFQGKTLKMRPNDRNSKKLKKPKRPIWTKATTTKLVHDVFETYFAEQLDKADKEEGDRRKKRCGVCEACQLSDCGKCEHCRGMLKFGGAGRRKQACKMRRCPNMAIQEAEESDNEDGEGVKDNAVAVKVAEMSKKIVHKVEWIGEPAFKNNDRIYYNKAKVGDIIIEPFDYVMLNSNKPNEPLYIARICYMWSDEYKNAVFHAHFFCRGTNTILGETADPRELFLVNVCENCPLGSIVRKAEVELKKIASNWKTNGGLDTLPPQLEDDGRTFFYSKRYDCERSRFVDVDLENHRNNNETYYTTCESCKEKLEKHTLATPTLTDDGIVWQGDVYKVGSGVYLDSDTFKFRLIVSNNSDSNDRVVDEDVYPEYYRKQYESVKSGIGEEVKPFCIGLIEEIRNKGMLMIKVRKFYRPENTNKSTLLSYQLDLNLLYWSEEEITIPFNRVTGKCYLAFADALNEPPSQWSQNGPNRFYFTQAYNAKTCEFSDVPQYAKKIGLASKGGKNKSSNAAMKTDLPPVWDQIERPLRCMDVFAGCGGLSEGLHQAGVAETKWAIEREPAAAQAFRINNPQCAVYVEDCNELLRAIINNERDLPQKGDVEMLVGGPPCQGFSEMNRFNAGQYSLFKNSLIVSFLSYCDYYRPKYFILENVRNFVTFKRGIVLKLTLRCLLAIGYQVTFGVLQAGHYGIPQTRRRLIVIAAAPGLPLPHHPEPMHCFHKRACWLAFQVDDSRYATGARWTNSAPYRMITVRDAMSDLPPISNGHSWNEMPYNSDALSHFQRRMRGAAAAAATVLRDHICKEMMPMVAARMAYIPTAAGSDWRDLPNIVVRLSDGTYTVKLRYAYKRGRGRDEKARGVCRCAMGGKQGCDPADRQFNTLIPWCLPHTGDRHNHWAGLYGRLEWDGLFGTTVTNPEPMGKQGRVLHPEQHRVVSVRECARSQGFPDRYVFYGSILDKHRQVGNAVPPPLGAALGREICKAIAASHCF